MWEFDRLREVVFQVDAWLPPDSPRAAGGDPHPEPERHAVPMYWWTNAAVPANRAGASRRAGGLGVRER